MSTLDVPNVIARRPTLTAALWITLVLLIGGFALDRALTGVLTREFDEQIGYTLTTMIGSAEIGPNGEVFYSRPLGDERFLKPNSGFYWQISGQGQEEFPSRSLWNRRLKLRGNNDSNALYYNSGQFPGEPLRMIERSIRLPGSNTNLEFAVAQTRSELDSQIAKIRLILLSSFAVLGIGLLLLAARPTRVRQ